MIKNTTVHGSANFSTAVLLNIAGGFLDAYTYYERGGVFANAQTGNIIKLGLRIGEGRYEEVPRFMIPVLSFCAGVLLTMMIEHIFVRKDWHCIRRTILALECILLIVVSAIPIQEETNLIACTIVSFVCAMQMEAFKKFGGYSIATTVGTGNLRQFTEHLFVFVSEKDRPHFSLSMSFLMVLIFFTGGVIIGVKCCRIMAESAVLVPGCIYFLLIILLSIHRNKYK